MATTDIFSSFAQEDNAFMDSDEEDESDHHFEDINNEAMIEPELMSVNLNGALDVDHHNNANENISQPQTDEHRTENVFDLFGDANDEPIEVKEADKAPMDLFSKITEVTENQINKIKETVNKVIEDDIAFNNLNNERPPSLPLISAFDDDDENDENENENEIETESRTVNDDDDEMALPQRRMPNKKRKEMKTNGIQTPPKYQSTSNNMLPRKYTPQTRGRGRGRARGRGMRRKNAIMTNKLLKNTKIEKLNLEQISTIKQAVNRASNESIQSDMEPIPLTPNEKSTKNEDVKSKFADISRSTSIEDVDINENQNENEETEQRKSIKVSTPIAKSESSDDTDSMPMRKKVIKKTAENSSKKYQEMSNDILPRKYKYNHQNRGRGRGKSRERIRPKQIGSTKQKTDIKENDLNTPSSSLGVAPAIKTRGNRPTRPPNKRGRGRGTKRFIPTQKPEPKTNGDESKNVKLPTNKANGQGRLLSNAHDKIQQTGIANEESKINLIKEKNDIKEIDLNIPTPTKETVGIVPSVKTRGNRPTRPPIRRGRIRGRGMGRGRGIKESVPTQRVETKTNESKIKNVTLATNGARKGVRGRGPMRGRRLSNGHSKISTNSSPQIQKKPNTDEQSKKVPICKQESPKKTVRFAPQLVKSEHILEDRKEINDKNQNADNLTKRKVEVNEVSNDHRKDYLLSKAKEYSRDFRKQINLGLVTRYKKIQAKFEKKMKRLQKELEITKKNNGTLKRQIEELSMANSPHKNGKIQNEEKEQKEECVDVIIRTFEDFMLMCNAPYSSDIFDNELLTNLRERLEYDEPNNIMKQCLYPTIIQNKNLFICSKSITMQMDAIALCIVLKLFSLINGADDQSDNIKILCICPTRPKCTTLHSKINHLLHARNQSDVIKQRVDLIIPGQPQSKQHHTLHSRPYILITTPVLMTDFILAQHPIKDYVACVCHKNVQKLFNCIAIINADQCLQSGFDQNIESILKQCNLPMTDKQNENKYEHEKEQKMIISSNNISPKIESFVEKLLPNNQDRYKLICSKDYKQENEESASDFLPNTNDYELDDKILLNTLQIQKRLKQKHDLISSLNKLLQQTEYKSILSTAEQLKDGSYHQTYNKKTSSNLTAKLNRMESKTKFMGAHSQQLIDNLNFKYLQTENARLQNELNQSKNLRSCLENDKESLTKALNLKISKIRQVEEEKGIVIGELRISLEEMSTNQTTLKKQMNEEKNLLTQSLKQMVEQLTNENKLLRDQISQNSTETSKLP